MLSIYKNFRKCPWYLWKVLCKFNLRSVPREQVNKTLIESFLNNWFFSIWRQTKFKFLNTNRLGFILHKVFAKLRLLVSLRRKKWVISYLKFHVLNWTQKQGQANTINDGHSILRHFDISFAKFSFATSEQI